MSQVNRRDVMKRVAGLGAVATGLGVLITNPSDSSHSAKAANEKESTGRLSRLQQDSKADTEKIDYMLKDAIARPTRFMFKEQKSFKVADNRYPVYFTSVFGNPEHNPFDNRLLPGSMCVFRADSSVDEFTSKGGLYWKTDKEKGKIQFKKPGEIFIAIRDLQGTVTCYTLTYDLRC